MSHEQRMKDNAEEAARKIDELLVNYRGCIEHCEESGKYYFVRRAGNLESKEYQKEINKTPF